MRLSWCRQTWYSAWCSLTTTPASLEPASLTLHIRPIPPAKKAPPSTLSQPPTAPTATKAGTHETNKSMCPSKALWLSLSVNSACQKLLCVLCVLLQGPKTVTCLDVNVCLFVWMSMFVYCTSWFAFSVVCPLTTAGQSRLPQRASVFTGGRNTASTSLGFLSNHWLLTWFWIVPFLYLFLHQELQETLTTVVSYSTILE